MGASESPYLGHASTLSGNQKAGEEVISELYSGKKFPKEEKVLNWSIKKWQIFTEDLSGLLRTLADGKKHNAVVGVRMSAFSSTLCHFPARAIRVTQPLWASVFLSAKSIVFRFGFHWPIKCQGNFRGKHRHLANYFFALLSKDI